MSSDFIIQLTDAAEEMTNDLNSREELGRIVRSELNTYLFEGVLGKISDLIIHTVETSDGHEYSCEFEAPNTVLVEIATYSYVTVSRDGKDFEVRIPTMNLDD